MPKPRIDQKRANTLKRRVTKISVLKGGITRLINGSEVYPHTIYRALKGKQIEIEKADKIEAFLTKSGIK